VTQELILAVLLTGLVGLIWVMTVAILAGDHQTGKNHGTSAAQRDAAQEDRGMKRRTIAA
jgi:catalase (peroxidase I)